MASGLRTDNIFNGGADNGGFLGDGDSNILIADGEIIEGTDGNDRLETDGDGSTLNGGAGSDILEAEDTLAVLTGIQTSQLTAEDFIEPVREEANTAMHREAIEAINSDLGGQSISASEMPIQTHGASLEGALLLTLLLGL